ncbi:MAG TPA: ABC transporter ATP-binding protein [Gammaproteobacteria bacterium]|jgi:peptide/nickel transport system ATP-binding protein|nr:ABC transporter ATP-binding protein [Gammaproteobacteria bacterium]|tara:strand:+ start:3313 stop:4956 length:1644 start_codon:yes stop_codon:yes gene_type:complete
MSENILQVKNLTVSTGTGTKKTDIVNNISFTIERGETFVLLGESGSGKSITALSIMRLLPAAIKISDGSVILHTTNLFQLPENKMRKIRGAKIGMIFQEPQTSLNPVLTAGQQISETLRQHDNLSKKQCIKRSIELLDAVGIPDAERRINEYPHQFSGGMKQRIMIAIALAGKPDLLIADEPTTALDVTIQAQVLNLLRKLQSETGMSILFITHDIGVASQMADHIAVMQNGSIVELKTKKELFSNPENSYTQKLFDAIPSWEKRTEENEIEEIERSERTSLLKVKDLKVYYPIRKGIFKRTIGHVRAVDSVTIDLHAGETVAIVGESGSGKTTMGKGILQLLEVTSGDITYKKTDLNRLDEPSLRKLRSDIQIIFQDPYSSMNPRMMVNDIIQEGMLAQGVGESKKERDEHTVKLLEQVGLLPEYRFRYPHEFSGGQRQRICIARALAVKPKLIICDEPTSALDVSVQAQILSLLKDLQKEYQLGYLFITHNISVVEYIAHYVAVMYEGKIVEQGAVEKILKNPKNPYTKNLLSAVPRIELQSNSL